MKKHTCLQILDTHRTKTNKNEKILKETLDPSFSQQKPKKSTNKLEKDTPFQIIEDFLHVRGLRVFLILYLFLFSWFFNQ